MGLIILSAEQILVAARPLHKNRTYVFVLLGNLISILGDTFHSLALGYWVLQKTESGTAMALITALKITTGVLAGPFAGAVADRVDRRRLMITMDLARFVLVGLMIFMAGLPSLPYLPVVLTACAISVCNAFMQPAFSASLIQIVGREQVGQAEASRQTFSTLAIIVGPSLGGAVYALWGAPAAFGFDALSYVLLALCILAGGYFASPRAQGKGPRSSIWADMREAATALRSQPLIKALLMAAPLLNFFGNAAGTVTAILVIKEWRIDARLVGVMEGALPVGALLGGLLLMAYAKRMRRRGMTMGALITVIGVLMGAVPLVGYWPTLPLMVVAGIGLAITNGLLSIMMREETPPEMQGRIFGLTGSISSAMAPVGTLVAGSLADLTGVGPVTIASGLGFTLLALIAWSIFPALRQYD
jgi:DHA3 family macrolide efflux protein-like MFS transporter